MCMNNYLVVFSEIDCTRRALSLFSHSILASIGWETTKTTWKISNWDTYYQWASLLYWLLLFLQRLLHQMESILKGLKYLSPLWQNIRHHFCRLSITWSMKKSYKLQISLFSLCMIYDKEDLHFYEAYTIPLVLNYLQYLQDKSGMWRSMLDRSIMRYIQFRQ